MDSKQLLAEATLILAVASSPVAMIPADFHNRNHRKGTNSEGGEAQTDGSYGPEPAKLVSVQNRLYSST